MSDAADDLELRGLASRAKRERRLPRGASCAACGGRMELGVARGGEVRCYAHLASDVARVELDHWLGRRASVQAVIPLEANAHRRVTDIRRLIGFDELPPDDGDPLLLLARLLEGIASLLVLAAEWLVEHVAAMRFDAASPAFPVAT